jgi:hypothetical protein
MVDAEKLAEELRTLPRGDARLFERLADSVQITPFGKQATASKSALLKLAALHSRKNH